MTSLAPHGGDALGATPGHPLLTPALSGARDLSMSRQQAMLDLAAIQRIPGLAGYWPADPAYLYEDSAGTIPASVGGVVGQVKAIGAGETLGPELADTLNTTAAWVAGGTNTLVEEDGALKATYVDSQYGGTATLSAAAGLTEDLVVGAAYLLTGQAKISSGGAAVINVTNTVGVPVSQGQFGLVSTDYVSFSIAFNPTTTNTNQIRVLALTEGEVVYWKNLSLKKLLSPAAIQTTTANKPYLRRTPTSGVYWLDSNTSTSALNVALSDTVLGRRNMLTYSEAFDNVTAWPNYIAGTGLNVVRTANAGVDPLGGNTADRIQLSLNGGTTASDISYISQAITPITGTYVLSFYLKSYDANDYIVSLVEGANGGYENITVTPTWQRFSLSATGTWLYARLRLRGAQGTSDTADILVFGAQLELGATATDYQRIVSAPAYCTVARATAEGVTFIENSEITPSYNIAPSFGFNGDIAIFNRALTVTERALLTRYMARGVPVLGTERLANNTFDADLSGWTYAGYDASNYVTWGAPGVARYQLASGSPVAALSQSDVITSGQPYLIKLSVSAAASGSVQVTGFGATGVAHTAATAGVTTQVRYATAAKVSIYRSIVPADVSVDSLSVRPIL